MLLVLDTTEPDDLNFVALSSEGDCDLRDLEDEVKEELRRRRSGLIFVEGRLVRDEDGFSWPFSRRTVREEGSRELVRRLALPTLPDDPPDLMYLLRYETRGEEERLAVLLLIFILGL